MGYIRGGIVTRIETCNSSDMEVVRNLFDLKLFDFNDDVYLLKKDIFSDNFWILRDEYLGFTCNKGDSIKNCEACYLNIDIHKLRKNKVILSNNNKSFYFSSFSKLFETDVVYFNNIKIHFISIYWDVNKIFSEDFSSCSLFVNNLTHNALKNILKGATWFTVL